MRKNDKGVVLLGAVFLVVFMGIILASSFLRSNSELDNTNMRMLAQKSFYAAETGLEYAMYRLRQDPDWRADDASYVDVPVELDDSPPTVLGTYTLTLTNGPDINIWKTVDIVSFGKDDTGAIVRTLQVRIMLENPAAYVIGTQGDLRVGSGAFLAHDTISRDVIIEDSDRNGTITIDGDMYYTRDAPTGPNAKDGINMAGDFISKGSMTFAALDLNYYESIATAQQSIGQGKVCNSSCTIDLSSSEYDDVSIVYVNGNAYVQGTYNHSMIVIAERDVRIRGSVVSGGATTDGATDPQIGLLAKHDVYINNMAAGTDVTVEAFVMADGAAGSEGGRFRSLASSQQGTLTFTGAISVRGDTTRSAVSMGAFRNRDYNYNEDLSSDRQIPFLPFIANQVAGTWREINPPLIH